MKALLVLMAVVGLVAGFLAARPPGSDAAGPTSMRLHGTPRVLPETRFIDDSLEAVALSDFRGRTVLLNLWATWCAPCVEEMPTLDALQDALGGPAFEVVALSVDRGGVDPIRAFYQRIGARRLNVYVDPSARALEALGAPGLPTTLLIDPQGREIARLIGPAVWDSDEMIAFLGNL